MPSIATAFAPASMGNVGIGFDILGLAYQQPGDEVEVRLCAEPGVRIAAIEGDGGKLPLDAAKNTASVAVKALINTVGFRGGMEIRIKKGMPLSSGLGGSAASSVAAVVAANALLENPLPKESLLPACLEGEALVSGYHPDNIVPCLFGGINLMTGIRYEDRHPLPVPDALHLALIAPDVAVPTIEARKVIPQSIPLKAYVQQSAYVAMIIDALYRTDIEKMAYAMEQDTVVEPARKHLMPFVDEARFTAKSCGAFGLVISGAGPTLCAVCDSKATCGRVADALKGLYRSKGIASLPYVTQVDKDGARLISSV